MWTPFDLKIADLRLDIGTVDSALTELSEVSAQLINLKSDLSNLNSHIANGFDVDMPSSADSAMEGFESALDTSKETLSNKKDSMKEELESLLIQKNSYIESQRQLKEQEAAKALSTKGNCHVN